MALDPVLNEIFAKLAQQAAEEVVGEEIYIATTKVLGSLPYY